MKQISAIIASNYEAISKMDMAESRLARFQVETEKISIFAIYLQKSPLQLIRFPFPIWQATCDFTLINISG